MFTKEMISQVSIKDSIALMDEIQIKEIDFYLHLSAIKEFERWKDKKYYIGKWKNNADELINGSFNTFLTVVFRKGEWWLSKMKQILTTKKFKGKECLIKYGFDNCSFLVGQPKIEVKAVIEEIEKTGRKSPFYIIHSELFPIKKKEEKTTNITDKKEQKEYNNLKKELKKKDKIIAEQGQKIICLEEKLRSYEILLREQLNSKRLKNKFDDGILQHAGSVKVSEE